jgi:hypothetical protein
MVIDRFLAATATGVDLAVRGRSHHWSIQQVLTGARVRCLAAAPDGSGAVYAGMGGDGVLKSDDGGRSWRSVGLDGKTVTALAASAAEPGLVVAGTRPARLYLSRNGGRSWDESTGFRSIPGRRFWFSPAEAPFTAYVQGLACSPVDPCVIVAGIEFGATVRSTDLGETWSGHLAGALRDCHSLASHPTDGQWVYEAGGTGAGAAVSRDGGRTWDQPRTGLDRHYGWACAADPGDPSVWYLSAAPGPRTAHRDGKANAAVFRMSGGTWRRLGGGLPNPMRHMAYSLLTDPEQPGSVCAALANGAVWESHDHGDTWSRLDLRFPGFFRVLIRIPGG